MRIVKAIGVVEIIVKFDGVLAGYYFDRAVVKGFVCVFDAITHLSIKFL